MTSTLCDDCPPVGYPTDKTRCIPCPRRAVHPSQPQFIGIDYGDPDGGDTYVSMRNPSPEVLRFLENPEAVARVVAAARLIETWWVERGMHESVGGAPYEIFELRAALAGMGAKP